MKKQYIAFFVFSLLFLLRGTVQADDHFAIAIEANTLGPGAEGFVKLTDRLNARVGGHWLEHDYNGSDDNVDYEYEGKFLNFPAILDWFPFHNGFHLSAGAVFNQNEIDATAKSSSSYTIGNTTYTSAQAGTLSGHADFDPVAPYVGFGWGTPFGKNSNWSFLVDVGMMYQGTADVSLSSNGALANDPTFVTNLNQEEQNLEDEFDKYQYYPVVSLAIAYSF